MFKKTPPQTIEVSERVVRRARQVPPGTEVTWIEGVMADVGRNAIHHRPGDPLLDEAIMGAETVLALLHQMKQREAT